MVAIRCRSRAPIAYELGARAERSDGAPGTFDRAVRAFGAAPAGASGAGVVQRVRVDDLELTDDEIWDEVSWFLFDDRRLPSELEDRARAYFDGLPEEAEYEYFEDIADQIEHHLRTRFSRAFEDWKPPQPSGDGGLLWKGMKLLVGYLAFSSLISRRGSKDPPRRSTRGHLDPDRHDARCDRDRAVPGIVVSRGTFRSMGRRNWTAQRCFQPRGSRQGHARCEDGVSHRAHDRPARQCVIATQHGVTESALATANPGLNWIALKANQIIIIPRHQ